MTELFELTGNMHMHTPYSDGEKYHKEIADAAIDAGLDYLIVTDHNIWVDGLEGYYENENGRVLLLVGEEVHNVRRQPQASHFLAPWRRTRTCQLRRRSAAPHQRNHCRRWPRFSGASGGKRCAHLQRTQLWLA
ncbi:MAG: PHP domain-containing protein [Chloroflexi bacterium]|nr:PHP domain-containing protein [Chloroflexota bacterium]